MLINFQMETKILFFFFFFAFQIQAGPVNYSSADGGN